MNNKKLLNALVDHLLTIDSRQEMTDFLTGMLTEKELQEIPMRLEIVKQLKAGIPQHVIAEKFSLGIATVTRGSNELKRGKFKNI